MCAAPIATGPEPGPRKPRSPRSAWLTGIAAGAVIAGGIAIAACELPAVSPRSDNPSSTERTVPIDQSHWAYSDPRRR